MVERRRGGKRNGAGAQGSAREKPEEPGHAVKPAVLRAPAARPAGARGSQPVPRQELGLCLRCRTRDTREPAQSLQGSSAQHGEGRRGGFGGTEQEWGRADGVTEKTSGAEFCQAKGEAVEMQV